MDHQQLVMLSEDQLYQMWCIYFKDSKMHQEQMKLKIALFLLI